MGVAWRFRSIAECRESSHQSAKVDTIASRRLFDTMLFIDGARTTPAKVKLGQRVTDARVDGDCIGDFHRRDVKRPTRLLTDEGTKCLQLFLYNAFQLIRSRLRDIETPLHVSQIFLRRTVPEVRESGQPECTEGNTATSTLIITLSYMPV